MYGSVSIVFDFTFLVTMPDFMIDLVRKFLTQTTQPNTILDFREETVYKERKYDVCMFA